MAVSARRSSSLPVVSIAAVAETAEPVITMGLRDDCASTDDLPAFASSVARRTDLLQATLWGRQLLCHRQGPLPGGLSCPIDVKDHACVACAINQLAGVSLGVQRAGEQIGEKERAQGFCGCPGQACQKARERRAGRQSESPVCPKSLPFSVSNTSIMGDVVVASLPLAPSLACGESPV